MFIFIIRRQVHKILCAATEAKRNKNLNISQRAILKRSKKQQLKLSTNGAWELVHLLLRLHVCVCVGSRAEAHTTATLGCDCHCVCVCEVVEVVFNFKQLTADRRV